MNRIPSIQTSHSYKLNPSASQEHSIWHDEWATEVNPVARQLDTAKELGGVGRLLSDIVNRTIKEVFREEGSTVIRCYIENKAKLKLEEVVDKPEEFSASLGRLLGSGAPMIEGMILKGLYHELGLEYEEKEEYQFSDYIKELNGDALARR
ncbi:MAG: hypothetical protein JSV58_04075 [Candidatus Bathyarchaeota archaeon]|nr:MAG: hypothetical protein JSV58_04075 [Candidatus Bathyarchaeota archaeon]